MLGQQLLQVLWPLAMVGPNACRARGDLHYCIYFYIGIHYRREAMIVTAMVVGFVIGVLFADHVKALLRKVTE